MLVVRAEICRCPLRQLDLFTSATHYLNLTLIDELRQVSPIQEDAFKLSYILTQIKKFCNHRIIKLYAKKNLSTKHKTG